MKSVYKLSLAFLLAGLLAGGLRAEAYQREYTKTIKKEFDITSDGTTDLTNKYGKVEVKTWDRNRVKLEVSIIVRAGSESQAQKVFDRINIEFSNSSNYVKAETVIEAARKSWWDWSGDDKSDYTINYEVYVPPANNIAVDNKYGDVYIAELGGRADLKVKYGNFKADGFGDDAVVDLAYGNGTLVRARDLRLQLSYGRLQCEEVKNVDINSKYSKFAVERAGDVRSESKYDDYNLGEIREFRNAGKYDNIDINYADNVTVRTKYAEVDIDRLGNSLELEMEYGNAAVVRLVSGFSEVSLYGKYTDFRLGIEAGADYRIDAAADHAGIRYPNGMTVIFESEKGASHEVRGYRGREDVPSVIRARLNYGGLKVNQD